MTRNGVTFHGKRQVTRCEASGADKVSLTLDSGESLIVDAVLVAGNNARLDQTLYSDFVARLDVGTLQEPLLPFLRAAGPTDEVGTPCRASGRRVFPPADWPSAAVRADAQDAQTWRAACLRTAGYARAVVFL